MKKQILIIGMLLGVLTMQGQDVDNTSKETRTGIKGGYNLASVSFDGEGETGQRHSFHVGIYGESFVSDVFAVQVELLYSQQGYEISNNSGKFTQKLNYINLPLMLKVYPTSNFFFEAGPQIGLAVSHKEEFDSNFNLFDTSSEFDTNKFDWGVNFGGGFRTDSGVSFGARYHLGLGDIYDEGAPKNRVWQFSIGFDF